MHTVYTYNRVLSSYFHTPFLNQQATVGDKSTQINIPVVYVPVTSQQCFTEI